MRTDLHFTDHERKIGGACRHLPLAYGEVVELPRASAKLMIFAIVLFAVTVAALAAFLVIGFLNVES